MIHPYMVRLEGVFVSKPNNLLFDQTQKLSDMESDDDYELLPSSPIHVHQRKLKRLKKTAVRVPQSPDQYHGRPSNSSDFETLHSDSPIGGANGGSRPELKSLGDHNALSTTLDASESVAAKEDGLAVARVLEFDSVAVGEQLDENVEACSMEMEKGEEVGDVRTEELGRKRRRLDSFADNKENKKKRIDGDGGEKKLKESTSNKRKAEKERRENLKQLRAESQRLLRETGDAAFKPIPLVQKPISSILDKIRQRRLEILKKSSASFDDDDDDGFLEDDGSKRACLGEEKTDKVEKAELEETSACPAATNSSLNASHIGRSNDAVDYSSCESIPSPRGMGSEPEHTFRAPIGDTQEVFSDSQRSDTKDEAVNEKPNNPSEEVFGPFMLAMNLKLDSAPPDDDVSFDDEDNDKENIDPHLQQSVDSPFPSSGDPVKAFVDEEAEEEDDSDNDLQRFQDNEEGEDDDDIEELNDMIATEYEEKPIDREKRDLLHQQWLEQQDTAGMDNLLQKLNCGSKLKESTSIEEEDEESKETENESDDEAEEYIAPSDAVKINLKKVKQMIPQMFTDKDDAYVSSDDEETQKSLAKQCLFDKAQEKATFLSPAEDESSREVFSLIKKLNVVPDSKRKGRTTSAFDMPRIGQNINISSKSSFVGWASNHFMPSAQKHGSCKVRSFIFGRDDSNSRTSVSMSDDSSDMIQRESQPPKTVSAKFQRNAQNKYTALSSASQKSSVTLLEILRRSSLHAEHCVQHAEIQQKESVFDAFKLANKPIKTEARV